MKRVDMRLYRDRLLDLRARLRGDVSAMENSTLRKTRSEGNGDLSNAPTHMADIGSDNFDQEFTLSLMQNDQLTLSHIEGALERIEAGDYGRCEGCGGVIPRTRLNAIPYTCHCVKCAAKLQGS